jgi:hypothetical protein
MKTYRSVSKNAEQTLHKLEAGCGILTLLSLLVFPLCFSFPGRKIQCHSRRKARLSEGVPWRNTQQNVTTFKRLQRSTELQSEARQCCEATQQLISETALGCSSRLSLDPQRIEPCRWPWLPVARHGQGILLHESWTALCPPGGGGGCGTAFEVKKTTAV